ncbi:recombinase family protein [Streptomyces thermodiastaticus]|uniref:recombinase family protein n=1 Tax=Streptomyces thermodiastaticus TaxID=44061 RepID=UPI00167247FE|nr:recombinase family protein [Streptomyces thermodiastaticus]MCE7552779.1 recombinase family protein [Streptomyces thermodiastaticus]GHF88955.1 integrase [Streptomyces thermodiastaticus]
MIPAQGRPMRAAIYCRLSRDDDSSTSIATQEADARAWCQLRGYEVVMVRHDVGVSGSIRPEERKGFREILSALNGIDVVVARSIDRFSRVTSHFASLVELLDKRGTTLADVHGQADLTSPYGRFVVTLMVAFAQLERETIQQRILRSRVELRQGGKWLGGAAPYGYRIVPDGEGNKRLDIDEEAAAVLREVIDRICDGHTLSAEIERLNSSGILSPGDYRKVQRGEELGEKRAKWTYSALYQHLRSEVLRGYRVQGKRDSRRVVRDSEGKPVRVGPALISDSTWRTLQATLDANSVATQRPRKKATMLLHVAWCTACNSHMHYNTRVYNGRRMDQYVCQAARDKSLRHRCSGNSVNAERLESAVEEWLLRTFGNMPYAERVLVGGNDRAAEIEELEADIAELAESLVGLRGAAKAAVLAQLEARQEALEEAQAEPVSEPEWRWVPTGETVAERWAAADTAGKRLLLLSMRIRASVGPTTKRRWDPERVAIGVHIDDPAAEAAEAVLLEEFLSD